MVNLPNPIQAGDSLEWTDSDGDHKASDGWTMKYRLVGPQTIDIVSTADGDNHKFTVDAATSGAYLAGTYNFQAYATKTTSSVTVWSGSVEILQDLRTVTGAQEARSHWEIVRDSIKAVMQDRATIGQMSMSIGQRQLQYMSMTELKNALRVAENEIIKEQRRKDIANGKTPGRIVAEFSGPPL